MLLATTSRRQPRCSGWVQRLWASIPRGSPCKRWPIIADASFHTMWQSERIDLELRPGTLGGRMRTMLHVIGSGRTCCTCARSRNLSYNASSSSDSGSSLEAATRHSSGTGNRSVPLSNSRSLRMVNNVFKIALLALNTSSIKATSAYSVQVRSGTQQSWPSTG